jgi:Tol biopolymer transport system component
MRLRAAILALLAAGLLAGADAGARPGPNDLEIWVASVDGTKSQKLTDSREEDDAPVVSPNGRKIAFVRGTLPSVDIWVMNANGSGQTQRTGGQLTERDPAWGPDSRAFAFTYFEPGCTAARCASIRVLDWTGGDVRRRGTGARFAPNGRMLAFQDPTGIGRLTRVGARYRRLLRGSAADPVWSPAGRRIAFERVIRGATYVAVMNVDGSRVRRLARGTDPNWSKRGLIAFVRAGDIYVVRPDGRGVRRLTQSAANESFPVWSPDGSKLAFVRQEGQDPAHLYVVGANGGAVTWISQQGGTVSANRPSWSPDSRSLYYAARLPGLPT